MNDTGSWEPLVSQSCDNSMSFVSNKLKMSKISAVLIKLFSVSTFSQSCDNSMSSVSNKLKMSKSELAAAIDRSTCCLFENFALKWPEVHVSRENNKKKSYKGEWLTGSLIDVGQIQVPYWTKWLLNQEIFW